MITSSWTARFGFRRARVRDGDAPAQRASWSVTIRGALVIGFAMVFGLWILSGYQLLRSLEDFRQRSAAADEALLRSETVLDIVRTNVLLGSVYLRDALLAENASAREYYRAELKRIHTEVDTALASHLESVQSVSERAQWVGLRGELEEYWMSRETVLASSLPDAPAETALVLEAQAAPARQSVLAIADALTTIQRESRTRYEQEATDLYLASRERAVWIASLAFVGGIAVAFVAARRVGKLGREVERQRQTEHEFRQDLERLSAGLVSSQEEERRNLARELHDAVGQALTAINMGMEVALRDTGIGPRGRRSLEEARTLAESTLQSVRNLSQLLHPPVLSDFGLLEAIAAHLRNFSAHCSIRAQLMHDRADERLPSEVELCAYRIVQEALTNVARHSGASLCIVRISRSDDALRLMIEDNGRGLGTVGIARATGSRQGLGLLAMRERAQALGGRFIIETRAEGGTRVTVQLPLHPAPGVQEAERQRLAG